MKIEIFYSEKNGWIFWSMHVRSSTSYVSSGGYLRKWDWDLFLSILIEGAKMYQDGEVEVVVNSKTSNPAYTAGFISG